MEKVGGERLEREAERLFEYLVEEEEISKMRAKTSESSGESKARASPSGPAAPQGGGVPMPAGLGDSVPETVKTKIGDSDQGDSEESKAKAKKRKTGKEEAKGTKRSVEDWDEHAEGGEY